MAGKNNDALKYGGIAEKPPNLTRHNELRYYPYVDKRAGIYHWYTFYW